MVTCIYCNTEIIGNFINYYIVSITSRTTRAYYLNKSLFFHSHILWNSLQFEIKSAHDLSNFERKKLLIIFGSLCLLKC